MVIDVEIPRPELRSEQVPGRETLAFDNQFYNNFKGGLNPNKILIKSK